MHDAVALMARRCATKCATAALRVYVMPTHHEWHRFDKHDCIVYRMQP